MNLADNPNPATEGQGSPPPSGAPPSQPPAAQAAPKQEPVGALAVFVFEMYFLLLGIATIYALWTIWPYAGAASSVRVFGFLIDFKSDPDARLLLVATLAGLLGALIHVTTSLATFVGNREFYGSWISWYVLRPLIGMALGLLFYLIVRGGLVTGTGANAVNPYGVAAISGLAGLFSKQTVDKLRDSFEHMFKVVEGGDQERHDSLTKPADTTPAQTTAPAQPGNPPARQ